MFPYKTIIQIQKGSDTALYIQAANALAREIRNGLLKPGTQLPGVRELGALLEVNRNTAAAIYEELSLQGYIELRARQGAFVSSRIPDIQAKPIEDKSRQIAYPKRTGYPIREMAIPPITQRAKNALLEFNDGLPDERIAPLEELTRSYRSLYKRGSRLQFGYSDVEGNPRLREAIAQHLNETRGYRTSPDNIFITKGSQMGIFLMAQLLLQKGDVVVVGQTNYPAANLAFQYAGASLHKVPVDALGLDTDALEAVCQQHKVRAVYVTPHHHFPTTVTLSACRRMKLLALAEKWGFAILEDDYDYDFHYKSAPILPLASADHQGMVVSIGSLSKNFSPALRVAYLVAPVNVILELSKLRAIIDRQGDYLLEQAIAELFKEGIMKRHLRKALQLYHERRDCLCELLKTKVGSAVEFNVPAGGLAVWATFDKSLPLPLMAAKALKRGLIIHDGQVYNEAGMDLNSTRLGFASLNPEELEKAVKILDGLVHNH